jgi:hypothetical protein
MEPALQAILARRRAAADDDSIRSLGTKGDSVSELPRTAVAPKPTRPAADQVVPVSLTCATLVSRIVPCVTTGS